MLKQSFVRLMAGVCSHHVREHFPRTVYAMSREQMEKFQELFSAKRTSAGSTSLDCAVRPLATSPPLQPSPSTSSNGNGRSRKEVSFEDLTELLNKGEVQLFDVREPQELEEHGRIPGAVNIPLLDLKCALQASEDEFIAKFGCTKPTKHCKCVFHSAGKVKSVTALEIAHRLGLKNQVSAAFGLSPAQFKALYGINKPDEEDENIVFSCRAGVRSYRAILKVDEHGFQHAKHYPGGWQDWVEKMSR